jgi:hypothetical protein
VEIAIAVLAGWLSSFLLAIIYLADRYEPEPIELIQDSFLTGLTGQLALILTRWAVTGDAFWSDWWMLVTVLVLGLVMPIRLARQAEVDERFDGIVYTVSVGIGAACAIHLNNLPWLVSASPYRAALAPGAEPDLRDLIIVITGSPGLSAELGRGVALLLIAVLVGAVLGVLQLRGTTVARTVAACTTVAAAAGGLDLAFGGAWWWRSVLALLAVAVAISIKRRSVFRDRPQMPERDAVVLGLKTLLIVLGAALLATVLLHAVIEQPVIDHPDALEPVHTSTEVGQ